MLASIALVLAAQSAVEAFTTVCGTAGGMGAMETLAASSGWAKAQYPSDVRAGFLVAYSRGSSYRPREGNGESITYAEAYEKRLAEGGAFLIVTRDEPLFGSKLPASWTCNIRIFDLAEPVPKKLLTDALGSSPDQEWRDDLDNEVIDWFVAKRFNGSRVQAASTRSHTGVSGPENLAGLSLLASGELH